MRDRPSRPKGPRGTARPRRRPSATRPVTRRPSSNGAGAAGAATRTSAPRPPSRLTGRTVILGVVLLALAMSYVFPLRVYLTQQAEIAELSASQAAQREHIAGLEAEAERWTDEEYIRIQARRRQHFVEPGEIPIITVWDEEEHVDGEPDAEQPAEPEPWWHTLWSSVQEADSAAEPVPPAGDREP